ncbi:MAG: poly(A) polymerase, partial [Sphaerochaetaceae bacterium]
MLVRYKQDEKGRSVAFASIYTPNEHHINPALIDNDALWAVKKLQQSGAEAYLVGGAVRDLLIGLIPKDFDITTSASPRQIQRIFYNARIIGRRFKLVHLVFGEKVIECSTFRSGEEAEDGSNNVFGSVDQDARRRDFTINSLYYNPVNGQLLDFNHAMEDFKKRRITSVIPLDESFVEDPVRMIRAVKYSVTTGFRLRWNIRSALHTYCGELSRTSTSRLTEEVNKILASGKCCDIFLALEKYNLLVYMLPCFSVYCKFDKEKRSLRELDRLVNLAKQGKGEEIGLFDQIRYLVEPLIVFQEEGQSEEDRFHETYRQIKVLLNPMTPPNYEIEKASAKLLSDHGFKIPRTYGRQTKASRPAQQRHGHTRAQRKR